MALIRDFTKTTMTRNSVHDEIEATYSTFSKSGTKYLQIDSYGRDDREMPGKKSQSIQLNEASAKALIEILKTEYPLD